MKSKNNLKSVKLSIHSSVRRTKPDLPFFDDRLVLRGPCFKCRTTLPVGKERKKHTFFFLYRLSLTLRLLLLSSCALLVFFLGFCPTFCLVR